MLFLRYDVMFLSNILFFLYFKEYVLKSEKFRDGFGISFVELLNLYLFLYVFSLN